MDSEDKNEFYAEHWQHEWTQTVVVPYLESAYPAEVAALLGWVEEHGGLRTTLGFLAGDARARVKGGRWSIHNGLFSVHFALSAMAQGVVDRDVRPATRTEFARDLHHAGRYAEALAILGALLARRPRLRSPRRLRADVLVHQGRYVEAAGIARRLLSEEPSDSEALRHLADAYEGLGAWRPLLFTASRLVRRHAHDSREQFGPRLQRALAFLRLDRLDDADAELSRLERTETRRYKLRHLRPLREELAAARGRLPVPAV